MIRSIRFRCSVPLPSDLQYLFYKEISVIKRKIRKIRNKNLKKRIRLKETKKLKKGSYGAGIKAING